MERRRESVLDAEELRRQGGFGGNSAAEVVVRDGGGLSLP